MDTLSKFLTEKCKQIKEENGWTSISRIVGEAVEDCVITMSCPICSDKSLVKYKANQKSKEGVRNVVAKFRLKQQNLPKNKKHL